MVLIFFFFSSRRRHTRCALVTGVQTCALPIYLNQPVEIEVAARNATADTVTQIAYQMPSDAKRAAVVHLVKSRGLKQVIVFSNTKIGTARLARELERDGVRAESIHSDKSQADRMKALDAFKAGELEGLDRKSTRLNSSH